MVCNWSWRLRVRPKRQTEGRAQQRPSDGDPVWIPGPEENSVLVALRDRGLYKAPLGDGKHDITCPWVQEHTGEVNGGTAYFEPDDNWPIGGFKCLHGHCADRHVRDLLRFVDVEVSAARMKPTIRVMAGRFTAWWMRPNASWRNRGGTTSGVA
jgi:hypothetical protein